VFVLFGVFGWKERGRDDGFATCNAEGFEEWWGDSGVQNGQAPTWKVWLPYGGILAFNLLRVIGVHKTVS
jgi:hypothetical protein